MGIDAIHETFDFQRRSWIAGHNGPDIGLRQTSIVVDASNNPAFFAACYPDYEYVVSSVYVLDDRHDDVGG